MGAYWAHWVRLSLLPTLLLPILTYSTLRLRLSLNEASSAAPGLDPYALCHSSSKINNPIISLYTINGLYLQEEIVKPRTQSPNRTWPILCLFYTTSREAYKQGDLRRLSATVEQHSPPHLPLLSSHFFQLIAVASLPQLPILRFSARSRDGAIGESLNQTIPSPRQNASLHISATISET